MLPANYAAIVGFLTAHGYTGFAAAGIAGNIYQESLGNPESVGSGGGGLIGWTPLPAGFVTGNPAADLQTQLQAILTFNQQWAQYIPALNAATSASEAADIYVTDFERAGIPAAADREAAANAVATACGLLRGGRASPSRPPLSLTTRLFNSRRSGDRSGCPATEGRRCTSNDKRLMRAARTVLADILGSPPRAAPTRH